MRLRDTKPHARANDGPDPLDLSSRIASRAEKASDCAARLREWDESCRMREVSNLLAISMQSLTARQRDTLIARFWAGMTLDEAGRALGVTRESVRQHEARALWRLRHPKRLAVRAAGALLGLWP